MKLTTEKEMKSFPDLIANISSNNYLNDTLQNKSCDYKILKNEFNHAALLKWET